MRLYSWLIALALAASLVAWPADKKKKSKKKDQEEITQVLELPKDPPAALVAEADRLAFQVTPARSRGLLSQQVRDSLKWLLHGDRAVVRLRAFVAGTGDTRRVQSIVSEVFTEKKAPLPTLSVVQIGALPGEGSQVVMEATLVDKKAQNPHGLAFVAGQPFTVAKPLQPVVPLGEKAIAHAGGLFQKAGVRPEDVLTVTCYLTSLDNLDKLRGKAAAAFPRAAFNFVQSLRGALETSAACEAVGRLADTPPPGLDLRRVAVVVEPGRRVALTGAQLAFGTSSADARLAWQRLAKTLEQVQVPPANTVVAHIYPLSRRMGELAEKTGAEFFGREQAAAITMLPFEGLPSMDASFSVDLIALVP